jgi:hypothetical protein
MFHYQPFDHLGRFRFHRRPPQAVLGTPGPFETFRFRHQRKKTHGAMRALRLEIAQEA